MRAFKQVALALGTLGATLALAAAPAGAFDGHGHPGGEGGPFHGFASPVFVQTDNLAGNQIAVYDRTQNGTLSAAGLYSTGGLGGQLEGSVVDHLASQGSLVLDRQDGLLLAVNAGSDTVSVFSVFGDRLQLRQTVSSGGAFPVSIAVQDGLVYVVNAEQGGSVQGFRVFGGRLFPIPGSSRSLGLNASATPQFVNTPGQVAFSPDGQQLLVTTKANGNDVDVFTVSRFGLLSGSPVVNELAGDVPFAIQFDGLGRLVLAEAGSNALADFQLHWNGQIQQISSLGTGQAATCWVTQSDGHYYVSNAASGSVSIYGESFSGALTLQGQAATDGGTVDASASPDGRDLYVQAGGEGKVDEYAIGWGGSLSPIGSVTVPGAQGGEGIVAG
jgi:DNA-binding beta-propeller fold protein YncE